MTEAEFLADLQTKVLWMGTPVTADGWVDDGSGVVPMKVQIVEMGLKGTATQKKVYPYVVLNKGVEGNPNPMMNETAYPNSAIELPVGDALTAVQYLETRKAAGDWSAYEYEKGRSDLGFFFAKVWTANGDGTESEQRIKVSYDGQGSATHTVVV